MVARIALLWGVVMGAVALGAPAVTPLPHHPGNIFLAGEEITLPLAEGAGEVWQVVDYDGKVMKEGKAANGQAAVGTLPVGYFELRRGDAPARISIGVLRGLEAPTPASSPIGADLAMSWFYSKDAQKEAVASLCKLAGLNWVRDRLAWGEMEPRRGEFAASTRYDASARILSAAGLRVLQVNHSSPGWANRQGKRFPLDLRDAHRFHREMARRWKGQVLAFEPWNEADIDMFGGHTGAEMASMQKASYLGLKAGNPEAVACLNVFAGDRQSTLEDLEANEAWASFDTCNLHHYITLDRYPAWYAAFRRISAGRPLWVTEFSMPVRWSGDEKAQELSDADLRTQAKRVPMVFATSLHEGSEAAFYFILGHYAEGKTQFGIIRRDLTPRPAYVALAAVGRLLADAKPLGKLKSESPAIRAYLFDARPDGKKQEVLVAWCEGEQELELPVAPVAVFDLLGRQQGARNRLRLTWDPLYVVLPAGSAGQLALTPPPARPPLKAGPISPLVLQAVWPQEKTILAQSAYRISSDKPQSIPVFLYNFSGQPARGRLSVTGPQGWKVSLDEEVEVRPEERKELMLAVDCQGQGTGAVGHILIRGDFGPAGRPVLSIRVRGEKE